MGCGSSSLEDNEANVCYVWGEKVVAKPLKPLSEKLEIGRPLPAVVPGAPKAKKYERLPAFELSLQWNPNLLNITQSDDKHQWSSATAKWVNKLFVKDMPSFSCGREQLIFVAWLPLDKDTRVCLLTSTGWLLLIRKPPVGATVRGYKSGWLEVHHVLHMRKIRIVAGGPASASCTFEADSGDANLQQSPAPLSGPEDQKGGGAITRSFDQACSFGMTTEQAINLLKAVRSLAMSFRGPPLEVDVTGAPSDFVLPPPPLPSMPADGGFCVLFFAYCACLCVPLSQVSVGAELLTGLPMLELDISGFPLTGSCSAQVAYAIKVAMLRTGQFLGLRRNKTPQNKPVDREAFQQLCGIFQAGRLLKLELQGASTEMVEKLCDTLKGTPKMNSIADLNLDGSDFGSSAHVVAKLGEVVSSVKGGLRRLSVERCGLTKVTALPLAQALAERCPKLEVLNLAKNDLKEFTQNPLGGIWKSSKIEVLDLTGTGLDFAGMVNAAPPTATQPAAPHAHRASAVAWLQSLASAPRESRSPGNSQGSFKVTSLRVLKLSGTAPVKGTTANPLGDKLLNFFQSLGANLEVIEVAGVLPSRLAVKAFVEALSKTPSPLLTIDFRGTLEAIPGLSAIGKAGTVPGNHVLMDIPVSRDEATLHFERAELQMATKWKEANIYLEKNKGPPAAALSVTVPNGVSPGQQLQVQAPDGRILTVTVPTGVYPGRSFQVQLPPPPGSAPAGQKSPADMQKEIARHIQQFILPDAAVRQEFLAAGKMASTVQKFTVSPPPGWLPTDLQFNIVAAEESVPQKPRVRVPTAGCGPKTALLIAGCEESKQVRELDITNCIGGDPTGVVLGALVLRGNRSLRSVKTAGNYFSVNAWAAIRGAFYGNRKILEFPFPQEDAETRITGFQNVMAECESNVVQCRARIKRAFKSTKGARTPFVLQTLNHEVENIKGYKVRAAKFRYNMGRFAKIQQEIQVAIQRNQEDPNNQAAQAKEISKQEAKAYKEADKALEKASNLEDQKKKQLASVQAKMFADRREVLSLWAERAQALKKSKQDTAWFETWSQSAARPPPGQPDGPRRPLLSADTAETLLLLVPDNLKSKCKAEIKRTEQLIQNEADILAQQESFTTRVEEQKLVAAKVLGAPGISKPSPSQVVKAGAVAPIKATVIAPPPKLVQAPIGVVPAVVVGTPGTGAAGAPVAGVPIKATVVPAAAAVATAAYKPGQAAPGAVVGTPATAAAQAARYDQFRMYQAQQQQAQLQYQRQQQQRMGGIGPGGALVGGAALGFGAAYLYSHWYWSAHYPMYGWHGPGFYGGYHHHHHDDDPDSGAGGEDVETYDAPEEASGLDGGVEVGEGGWEDGLGEDPAAGDDVAAAADGGDVGAGDVADAGEDVGLYAGGEDDRPGGGPPHCGSAAVRAWEKEHWRTPTPARLDLAEWFETRIKGAETAAREAALGREGALPCPADVLLRTRRRQDTGASVCLVTQCSLDRLPQLEAQLQAWDGEVSVAIYIDGPAEGLLAAESRRDIVQACSRVAAARAAASPEKPPAAWTVTAVYRIADEEVLCPSYDRLYPVNTLRNVALKAAQSELVFLVDVDFVPSHGLYERLTNSCESTGKLLPDALRHGGPGGRPVALVVPAFEGAGHSRAIPLCSESLRAAYDAGEVEGFHVKRFPKGHRATDFARWFAGPAGELQEEASAGGGLRLSKHGVDAYPVTYEEHYEPYVVALRDCVPAYDERFRGYGLNKISHLYTMAKAGFSFCVVDDREAFVVAGQHERSQSWKAMYGPEADCEHRARLATHFAQFKAELQRADAKAKQPDDVGLVKAVQVQHCDDCISRFAAGYIVVATATALAQELARLCQELAFTAQVAARLPKAPIVA